MFVCRVNLNKPLRSLWRTYEFVIFGMTDCHLQLLATLGEQKQIMKVEDGLIAF